MGIYRNRVLLSLLTLILVVAVLSVGPVMAAETGGGLVGDGPTFGAIAIGQLQEDDGETATIDLRAGVRSGVTIGTLRFYSEEHGYYNGGVRGLTVEDGLIRVNGGGVLIEPDGNRRLVIYQAEFALDTKQAKITVRGRGGYEYTLDGVINPGLVWAGDPTSPGSLSSP